MIEPALARPTWRQATLFWLLFAVLEHRSPSWRWCCSFRS